MRQNTIKLIVYRLYNPSYASGNPKTLSVRVNTDNTIGYSYYGGHGPSGMGFAISNMQLRKELPMTINSFKDVVELDKEIKSVLATGVGSRHIKSSMIVNKFPTDIAPLELTREDIERKLAAAKGAVAVSDENEHKQYYRGMVELCKHLLGKQSMDETLWGV